jgi:VCBS repeat-containing protein
VLGLPSHLDLHASAADPVTPSKRGFTPALLLAVAAMLLLASTASAAVTQKQAAALAVDALGVEERNEAVIVFGLPKPIRTGTRLTQAGTTKPGKGSRKGLSSKLRSAGVRTVRPPGILTARTRSYFFYEDRGPFQLYQHPGRVALVDVATGRVRISRTITWPPLINRRLPAFLRSAARYRSSKYQVFYRPWAIAAGTQQPRVAQRNLFDLDPFGPGKPLPSMANAKAIADRLAAERSCILRVSDTLPSFWNVNELNLTRSYVGTLFEALERQNPGFIDDRYGARSGETLGAAVDRLVEAGCKDILLYIAGQGYDSDGEPVVHLGTSLRPGGLLAQQNITAGDLRSLVSARPGLTFKFKFDVPFSGGMIGRLRDLPNVLLIETPAPAGQEAFAFIPNVEQGGQMVPANTNAAGLLEFTNCEFVGLKAFFDSAEEIDKATQAQNEGVSFLAEMLARSQELCKGVGFADDLGASPQLYAAKRGSGQPTNRPPVANPQSVEVTEDEPKDITLTGSDPDGDPLSFQVTSNPSHGTLSGTAPNLTYTPNPDYTGPDSFQFKVTDPHGASDTETVSITVKTDNDPPVVTSSSGCTAYTEQGAEVQVDPGLTVSDPDDSQLDSATVRISSNFESGDVLSHSAPAGISGTYNTGTGVLTLTGNASVSDYQSALRSVEYSNASDDSPPATKTIEFRVDDGDSQSNAATKDVCITPVNDAPVVDTTDTARSYTEDSGPAAIDSGLTVTDPDSAQIQGATVQITGNFNSAHDELDFSDQLGISGSYNDSTGTLTLTGTTSVANYQTALRAVTYEGNNSGANKTVSFRATDTAGATSAPATRDINITPANDAPVVTNSAGATSYTEDDAPTVIDNALTVSDPDDSNLEGAEVRITSGFEAEDVLSFTPQFGITGNYDSGTGVLTLMGTASVSDYQTALRSIEYEHTGHDPAPSKTVQFTAGDGDADSAPSTKDIAVTPVNDAPVLDTTDAAASYTEGDGAQPVDDGIAVSDPDSANLVGATIQITSNFSSAEDDLSFAPQLGITGAYNDSTGTLTLTGTTTVANYQAALRDVRYVNTSEDPSSATRTVSFRVDDGEASSNLSNVATRDIQVTPVADDAVANDDSATVTEDDPATAVNVLANDTDAEGDPITISSASDPAHGTVVLTGGSPGAHTGLTYQPDPNYCNNPPSPPADTFTYEVNGGDTATVFVTVTCSGDDPVASDDTATVGEDSGATNLNVTANDTDADGDQIEITNVSDPVNGSTSIVDGNPDQVSYTPDSNYCNNPPGVSPDTFTYTVSGGDTATVSVTVDCVDDSVTANDDTATVGEDGPATAIPVLSNDTDAEGDPITISSASDPAHGTVVLTGGSPGAHTGLTYQPDPNYCNNPPSPPADTFTYEVNGGDTATVFVTVTCSGDDPVASDDTATVGEDSGATNLNVTANDTDADGDQIEITAIGDPPKGTVSIVDGNPDQISYTPDANACNNPPGGSPDTFTYTVNGGDTATVSVTVDCVNDAPVANDDTATVSEDSSGSGNDIPVLSNDTDVESDAIEITNVSDPANGMATIVDGSPDKVNYQPDANYCNNPPSPPADTLTYTVNGGDTATVSDRKSVV